VSVSVEKYPVTKTTPVPETPYLAVDIDVLKRNLAAMAVTAAERGLALRPHVKTHKSPEIAALQLEAGAVGITVATVSEAEVFAEAGFGDVFIAYPLWVDSSRGARLRALAERCVLLVGVDSAEGAQMLARNTSGGGPFSVLVEIDSGHHRTGVVPDQAGELAAAALAAGLDVRGVFTFPGHSYGPGLAATAAADEARALDEAVACLLAAGIRPEVVSGGSTPTAALSYGGTATELRPGVYVFNDAQQFEMGTCELSEVALTAVGTVVSRAPGRVVLDAGSKTLGADRPAWATGFGLLADYPQARVSALSEHHATVAWAGLSPPELGTSLRVVPNHACAAVNLADELFVVRAGAVIERWKVAARGANN
jgi:D-serine deaminase-like pyridoxal phosphate-dependent protein